MNTTKPLTTRFALIMLIAVAIALGLSLQPDADPIYGAFHSPLPGPGNDDFDNATGIPGLPFGDAIDTSLATTAADDPDCFGQGPTVWYSFVASADLRVSADTFGSDYDTTLSAYTGSRGALNQIACNDDANSLQSMVTFGAIAGETYYFMVGAFASGPGGNLVFSVDVAPPPLTIDLIIEPVGSVVPRTGVATLRGTVRCSQPAIVDLFGNVQQKAGRVVIRGFFGDFFDCDGETPWSATITSENGRFVGGKVQASVFAFAFAPDTGEFVEDQESTTVQLRGSRR